MKKKIAYIIISLIALLFLMASYYKSLVLQIEQLPQFKQPKVAEQYSQNLRDTDSNTIATTASSTKLSLNARSACLMDASNNRVLYEKDGFTKMPMASTTKIMTLIVTLENADLDDVVTVSKNAARQPDVQLNMKEGEQYKLGDLVYSLMLESHNDTAVAIAEHVGGSVEGFATMMNKKAKELGCVNTNFVTPNGLDSSTDEHFTTAQEMGIIASYAIKNEEFVKITNTPTWNFKEIKSGRSFSVSNKDRFLYIYDGAIGIKTGYTNKAGYCFVGAVDREGKKFISVVLASGWPPNKNYKWSDTTKLMDYGVKNFTMRNIFDEGRLFEPIFVRNGKESYVDLYCEGELNLLMSDMDKVTIEYDISDELKAPVHKDSVAGVAKYYINDNLYEKIPVYTSYGIDKIDFSFCLDEIINLWFGNGN
ncbi:MAG TPA: D-alanyl-D-alanine carboxypeptidase family protein [Lachnospiraceae bacterium]|nr:D-alanyl-D-alanine carboxypeptidase family protein [Lachnospiraceae bacterium]